METLSARAAPRAGGGGGGGFLPGHHCRAVTARVCASCVAANGAPTSRFDPGDEGERAQQRR
jgi:hypothetical protein